MKLFTNILKKIIGDKNEKRLKTVYPMVDQINKKFKELKKLTDEEIKSRVQEIKTDIQQKLKPAQEEIDELTKDYKQEHDDSKKNRLHDLIDKKKDEFKTFTQQVLDDNLIEVFAIVKDTCRRLAESNYKYEVRGDEEEWFMVPFDEQLIGGIILHSGEIAEMATGEGKTLVATMPLFLNALTGRPVHLVTVNDYLAQRDSEWMNPVFAFHGITVGVIYNNMPREERKEAYSSNIIYGTNSEFGFDYLRDNMAVRKEQLVQEDLYFTIVDEIDSALIDEARTPLIISGPVENDKNFYRDLKPNIRELVKKQKFRIRRILREAEDEMKLEEPDWMAIARKLLIVKRGDPKNKRFSKLMQDSELKKMVDDYEGNQLKDKKLHEIDAELFYTIEENKNSCDFNEDGQDYLSKIDDSLFVMESLDEELTKIDKKENLSDDAKLAEKKEIQDKFIEKNEKLHNMSQLLKAFSLFEKDVDYIVQDNQVMIVDEFTGRMMPGRRFSDGLHQAIEAKENVRIQEATQTYASITLQNFFKKYDKLAGMTGTAETEEGEFGEIYDLAVTVIPTHEPITRFDHDDLIFMTKKEKYNAVIKEIKYWHDMDKPVLVGTVSVEVSELISKLLNRNKIPHKVLNAKNHEKEAQIVSDAGQPGAVTIATNMAGRGTDIKLGEGVISKENKKDYLEGKNSGKYKPGKEFPFGAPLDGLHVIGTERHESRRIDRQLRGRAGRQGDPGTSRFYLSLEDNLMRLFGSNRIAPMLTKLGIEEGEAITHPWMTKSVSKAQSKVENHNFEIRKQLLEYDEVQNQQREVIYSYRRRVLQDDDISYEVETMIEDTIDELVHETISGFNYEEDWPLDKLVEWIKLHLNISVTEKDIQPEELTEDNLYESTLAHVMKRYNQKKDMLGEEKMKMLENHALLSVVDDEWKDHLHEIDHVKEGIGLRAYAQKDPLIEYKKETFKLFESLISRINRKVTQKVFNEFILTGSDDLEEIKNKLKLMHDESNAYEGNLDKTTTNSPEQTERKISPRTVGEKVGRNDPCPCGSGKKYKKCCGRN